MLGPCCKQKTCAAVRVENEEPYIVLAQCLRVILVHVPVGGLLIGDGPAKHAQHVLKKELHRINLASPCHTTRSVHARYTCYLPRNTHTYNAPGLITLLKHTFCRGVYTAPHKGRLESPDFARVEIPFAIATVIVDTATCTRTLLQTEGLRCCQSGK